MMDEKEKILAKVNGDLKKKNTEEKITRTKDKDYKKQTYIRRRSGVQETAVEFKILIVLAEFKIKI